MAKHFLMEFMDFMDFDGDDIDNSAVLADLMPTQQETEAEHLAMVLAVNKHIKENDVCPITFEPIVFPACVNVGCHHVFAENIIHHPMLCCPLCRGPWFPIILKNNI